MRNLIIHRDNIEILIDWWITFTKGNKDHRQTNTGEFKARYNVYWIMHKSFKRESVAYLEGKRYMDLSEREWERERVREEVVKKR